jgi:hypothetical protein
MDATVLGDISELTIKEIRARLVGVLSLPGVQTSTKATLLDYISANLDAAHVESLQRAGQDKRAEKQREREAREVSRKRKRNEQQNTRRVAQRLDEDEVVAHDNDLASQSGSSSNHFLQLPTDAQVKSCYRAFYNATSNEALAITNDRGMSLMTQSVRNTTVLLYLMTEE